ncbi:arylsulfatase [Algoriphagus resistens]|uniref:arylsulfatase n=1 Tax=Algoriphagus resistens TaxID=1750590 RepID=UPI0009EB1532|nr:arylsulfatase [Algoriphagus resistens]
MKHKFSIFKSAVLLLLLMPFLAQAQDKPNILVIWGDDIGWSNVSAYNHGMMGYKTPNIDRLANEGAMFTDWYAQQSCTAGRAAFILGQHPFRTGLLTIGMPGSKQGIQDNQPTIAELLKPLGYTSGQFGKNHLGDQDEHLPTNHGFDEFFGNLYHLNAEEEPEGYYYPKDPEFRKNFGPRGVLHSTADGNIQDTGPLTSSRMETVDEEFEDAAIAFIEKAHAEGTPFFVWLNATRMHIWTHLKEESVGVTGIGLYPDGMVEHDKAVGRVLDKLDELGITDNTIVMWSTDNGAEKVTWPDGGSSPFKGEKGTTWEGGFRVPTVIRWPGVIKPGTVYNDIFSHEDMMPTLLAAAGEPNIVEKVLNGHQAAGKTFKAHLDGYNLMPYFKGEVTEAPRKEIFYFDQGGGLNAIRYQDWKLHFTTMEGNISTAYKMKPAWPLAINLRADPYEVSPESGMYIRWYGENMWLFVPAQSVTAKFLATFKDFPPVQGSSLSVDEVLKQMLTPARN